MGTHPGYTGRYELQELLGQGGMTEVWKAFDTQTRQYVAIKFLHANVRVDPDFAQRFQREAQSIASLRHPNIVQYHDFFISQPPGAGNTTASIVMDYIDGGTLNDYIRATARQGKFLPVDEIIQLFTTIGLALDYAHQHGVVHGQLKPANILLDRRNTTRNPMGEPVVADFGMLRLLATTAGSTGWWLGTPLYTSPEQIMGTPGDARSDIYALGIMLYEMCAGTPPFPGNNPATIMMQHMSTIPASPMLMNPAIPSALAEVITHAIAKDPAQRLPSAAALLSELARVAGRSGSLQTGAPSAPEIAQVDLSAGANLPTMMSAGPSAHLAPPAGLTPAPALPSSVPGISSGPGVSPLPGYAPVSSPGVMGASQPVVARAPGAPITPMPTVFAPGLISATTPALQPASPAEPSPAPPVPRRGRRRGLWVTLSVALALLVIGSGLGAYLVAHRTSAPMVGSAPALVGHAYFVSSGLLSANEDTTSAQGITDQLVIKLENVPQPPPGKVYYAWLLNAKSLQWQPIRLGALTVENGTLTFAYPGDAQHTNLLATNSRFLITEEDIASPSLNPASANLVYYAAFSEVLHPFGNKMFSLYDHIRHLLSNDPDVSAVGLTGGLDIWLYRNSEKILEWAGSARDADLPATRNLALVRRQLTRIIDYLDGVAYAQLYLPGQPLLVDPTIARLGLLTFDVANQNPPGYLYHMEKHLHEIAILPEATAAQKALAQQIDQDLNAVNAWDETLQSDALALLKMNDTQLSGSQGILNEVAALANEALVGQVDPQGQVTGGVMQIHYAVQQLATFDVRACTASNPCPALV